jgi:hypothetical protein
MNATPSAIITQDTRPCVDAGRHQFSTRHTGAECIIAPESMWDRCDRLITKLVAELNEALGLSTEFDANFNRNCVTRGYLGNRPTGAAEGSKHDDRSFFVFLPHPNRPGTHEDRIGDYRYGDEAGARACVAQLAAMVKLAKWQAARA